MGWSPLQIETRYGRVKKGHFHPLASLFKGRWRDRTGASVGFCFIELPFFALSSNPLLFPLYKRGTSIVCKGDKM